MAEESPGAPCGSHKRPRAFYSASSFSSCAAADDYDVFLNHRGPDVKGCFVSHLYEALKWAGLNPFLDKKSLVTGGHATESISAALEGARVHVAVVSEGYADSKHCLSELVAMMSSGKPVIPVFYDVEPAVLRWVESGLFGAAFAKHKSRETVAQVQEWANALGKLADITGFCFRLCDFKGDEVELKQQVVQAILDLIPTHDDLSIDPHLVGMEGYLKTCIDRLEKVVSGTSLLGLVGMGGVGKTTLAKVICHHFGHGKRFQATSFLELGRDLHFGMDGGLSLVSRLQRQLLWDLLHVPENSPQRYAYWFRRLLRKGPVLIVMDDLCDKSQFDELILNTSLLASGSCIIATSRDRHVLNVVGGGSEWKYVLHEVTPLEDNDSQKLFNWHAFGEEEAPKKVLALAHDVSKACGGLPLALKAIGSSLFANRSDEDLAWIWPEAIHALRENPNVMGALQWSYDQLLEPEKLMFVDVACVFYGWKKEEVLDIWKGCKKCCRFMTPHTSLQRLIERSLLVLTKDIHGGGYHLVMHKLLQDLGQSIGRVNGSHVGEDEAMKVVGDKYQVPNRLRALNLANNIRKNFKARDLTKFRNLHYLVLDGCNVSGGFGSICKELRWLQWRNMPLQQAPLSMLDLSNLVSLDFSESSMLASIWIQSDSAMEGFSNLLRLNLSGCTSITMLPNSIGCLSRLQVLDLVWCSKLQELPSSVGQLTSLQRLWLGGCGSLKVLPDSVTELSCLQELGLGDCSSISKLPMSLGLMESLSHMGIDLATECLATSIGQLSKGLKWLWITRCKNNAITMLDSLGALTHVDQLQRFNFSNSPMMTQLPETMGLLTNLEVLHLYKCERVRELPKSIGYLKRMKQLWLRECNNLESLPSSMDSLSSLQRLVLANCTSITKLPSSIGNLSRLKELEILGCRGLESLPESLRQLNFMQFLAIMECGKLEDLGASRALQGLRMWGCTTISKLPGSYLMVVDNYRTNSGGYYDYNVGRYDPICRKLKGLQVLEENDCGLLRMVDDGTSRSILQKVYWGPCL